MTTMIQPSSNSSTTTTTTTQHFRIVTIHYRYKTDNPFDQHFCCGETHYCDIVFLIRLSTGQTTVHSPKSRAVLKLLPGERVEKIKWQNSYRCSKCGKTHHRRIPYAAIVFPSETDSNGQLDQILDSIYRKPRPPVGCSLASQSMGFVRSPPQTCEEKLLRCCKHRCLEELLARNRYRDFAAAFALLTEQPRSVQSSEISPLIAYHYDCSTEDLYG